MEIVKLIGVDSKGQQTSFDGPARKLCEYVDRTATTNIDVAHLAKLTDINPWTIRTILQGLNYLINEVQESEDISKIRVQYLGEIVYNSNTNTYNSNTNTFPNWDWYTFVDES